LKRIDRIQVTRERHSRPSLLSDFILGSQDGLVNVLGIILGLAAANTETRIFFVAAFAALVAEAISMGAVAYTSTKARRQVYLKENEREIQEMRDVPQIEKDEVKSIFTNWGYEDEKATELTEEIAKNPKAMLEFMMSYELHLAPVGPSEARRSALIVGSSTIFGSFIPILPYFFVGSNIFAGTIASVVSCGVVLFLIGMYAAKMTLGSLWKSGLQLATIGLTSGLAGFIIGYLIGAIVA
jgi:predicted membrane protein (TIGR00267 family)